MTYVTKITAPEIKQQILLLEEFPEIYERHFRPALQVSAEIVGGAVMPTIPVRTGRARNAFRIKVAKGAAKYGVFGLEAHIGWEGAGQPWYINVVEYGASKHEILPGAQHEFLHFGDTFARSVQHPGFPARKFMARGLVRTKPAIEAALANAAEGVVKDLAVP